MASEQEEKAVYDEFLQKAQQDVKESPVLSGKRQGIMGIVFGVLGLLTAFSLIQLFFGFAGAGFAAYANKHGSKRLGIIGGILALINLLGLLLVDIPF